MKINPDEVVSVHLTYRQIAKLYAIMGRASGCGASSAWGLFKEILKDSKQEKYNNFIYPRCNDDVVEYSKYQDEWEKIIFGSPKSEAEIQLEKLEDKIKELQEEAQKLKETMQK